MYDILNWLRLIGNDLLACRYLETSRPNTQITYTFFPQTIPASSMIMKPPGYVNNPHPPYYISVNMNCFTPSSYITTIRKDGWEGEVVGDFEYGVIVQLFECHTNNFPIEWVSQLFANLILSAFEDTNVL